MSVCWSIAGSVILSLLGLLGATYGCVSGLLLLFSFRFICQSICYSLCLCLSFSFSPIPPPVPSLCQSVGDAKDPAVHADSGIDAVDLPADAPADIFGIRQTRGTLSR